MLHGLAGMWCFEWHPAGLVHGTRAPCGVDQPNRARHGQRPGGAEAKSPRRDDTMQRATFPLEVMQRLAAQVHLPQLRLIRFHDVLAPAAKLRAGQDDDSATREQAEDDEPPDPHGGSSRISGAQPLERAFVIDLEHRLNCGSVPTIIADTHEAQVIEHIREHLGLPACAARRLDRAPRPQQRSANQFHCRKAVT
jgi:hypothetical protein